MTLRRYRDIGWLNELRFGWENLNYGWQRWVLDYQGERQLRTLERMLGNIDARQLGLLLVACAAVLIALLALLLLKPWKFERDPQLRLYRRFERLLARRGVIRQDGEGARDFAERAALQLPSMAEAIGEFALLYERARYAGEAVDRNRMQNVLARLGRRLPWRSGVRGTL